MKVCEKCGDELFDVRDGINTCDACEATKRTKAKKEAQRKARQARDEAMRSLGLVKVRGARGGTYWE